MYFGGNTFSSSETTKEKNTKFYPLTEIKSRFNFRGVHNSFENISSELISSNENYEYFSSDIFKTIPISETTDEENFFKKQKIVYTPPELNCPEKITFQRQKDKEILEFKLFNDKTIFKDVNKSYLQNQLSDDGSDSSERLIEYLIRVSKYILSFD